MSTSGFELLSAGSNQIRPASAGGVVNSFCAAPNGPAAVALNVSRRVASSPGGADVSTKLAPVNVWPARIVPFRSGNITPKFQVAASGAEVATVACTAPLLSGPNVSSSVNAAVASWPRASRPVPPNVTVSVPVIGVGSFTTSAGPPVLPGGR
jgi:hypothetical protein